MSATQKFIRALFGDLGTRTAVPDLTQPDGSVSYQAGYGPDYARVKTDPLAKNIERDKMNQLFYDLSLNQRQYQLNGHPEYVPAADNGGVAPTYAAGATVLYTDGFLYDSLVAGNNVVPGTDVTKWRRRPFNLGGSQVIVTATGTIPAASAGCLTVVNAAAGTTQTLPAANSVAPGTRFEFMNINTGLASIARAGADVLRMNSTTITNLAVNNGDTLTLISDGASTWYAVAGSAALQFTSTFGASTGATNFLKLPGGIILQWGTSTATNTADTTITLPIAFPNFFRSIVGTFSHNPGSAATGFVETGITNLSSFVARNQSGSTAFGWIALGN